MPAVSKAQYRFMRAQCRKGKQWACEYVKGQSPRGLPSRKRRTRK
jgi:hypothetical protein